MTWAVTSRAKSKILHYWISGVEETGTLRLMETKCGMSILDDGKPIKTRGRHCKRCSAALAKDERS